MTHFSLCLVLISLSSSSSLFSLCFSLFYVCWLGGFATMGNGFTGRCGGMVVSEIGVVGLLPWVMGLLINVVAWLLGRSLVVCFVVDAVGFSWWLLAWVSLGDSCGGFFFCCFFIFWKLLWLLLVEGLVVFLMGFGGWQGGGVVVATVIMVVVAR